MVGESLLSTDNAALDTLFRSSPAGATPVGELVGTVLVFPGTAACRPIAAFARAFLWQGKVFDPERGDLLNRVSPLRFRAIRALVSPSESWVDGQPCVLIDYSKTSWLARMVRDEIRLVDDDVYLGVVWLWRRRAAWFVLRRSVRT